MTTVNDVVSRVYREYLYAPDEQPTTLSLDGAITAAATSLSYTAETILPDEESLLGTGLLVEVDYELMMIEAVNTSSRTLVVRRGMAGTTATTHADDALITLNPSYARQTVLDAVADEIVRLHPPLLKISSFTATAGPSPVDCPADVTAIREVLKTSDSPPSNMNSTFLPIYPASATGKAVVIHGTGTGLVITQGRFSRPTASTDDLVDLGVDESWVAILTAGAAGHLLMSRDVDTTNSRYTSEQMEAENTPLTGGERVARGLLRYRDQLLIEAASRQRAEFRTRVQKTNPLGSTSMLT